MVLEEGKTIVEIMWNYYTSQFIKISMIPGARECSDIFTIGVEGLFFRWCTPLLFSLVPTVIESYLGSVLSHLIEASWRPFGFDSKGISGQSLVLHLLHPKKSRHNVRQLLFENIVRKADICIPVGRVYCSIIGPHTAVFRHVHQMRLINHNA